jgi:hypothetical protein
MKTKQTMKEEIELRKAVRKMIMEHYEESEIVEEGVGKYLAGAALAASLAGAPMKGSAQTPAKDFAKEKIAMVQDKASDIKSNVKDFAKDQFAGAKEKIGSLLKKKDASQPVQLSQNKTSASFDSLDSQVGKIVKVGEGRYMTVEREDFDSRASMNSAETIAKLRAQNRIATFVKGKEISPGRVVTSARMTDTQTEERLFQNPDGGFTLFVTVSSSVN